VLKKKLLFKSNFKSKVGSYILKEPLNSRLGKLLFKSISLSLSLRFPLIFNAKKFNKTKNEIFFNDNKLDTKLIKY